MPTIAKFAALSLLAAALSRLCIADISTVQRTSGAASAVHAHDALSDGSGVRRQLLTHAKLGLVSPFRRLFPDDSTPQEFIVMFDDIVGRDAALAGLGAVDPAATVVELYSHAIAGAHVVVTAAGALYLCQCDHTIAVEEQRTVYAANLYPGEAGNARRSARRADDDEAGERAARVSRSPKDL